ncbi:MAG: hypothetical protein ABI705_11645 [Aestuariivirga sp.]
MSMPMMTNMMSGRMKMMAGGTQIGMDGMEMSAMGMTERVEGRIAFLRAELKVNDAQAKVWNKFSDLLRNNANVPMMPDTSAPQLLA